jgi:hypothetical protein
LLLGVVLMIPIAMNGAFAGAHLVLELAINILGIGIVFAVLLRSGLLAMMVTFDTFMAMEAIPLTADLSRPYAGSSGLLIIALVAVSAYGFYASRGGEPLFGRALLD